MRVLPLVRRFWVDYARNGVNVVVLVLVPAAFVLTAAPALARAATVIGGPGGNAVRVVTAGWSAAFLAAVAMYFQIASGYSADARLAQAGAPVARITAARLTAGLAIAAGVSAVSLAALSLRGPAVTWRAVAGTALFAVTYLGIGALVAACTTTHVNGTIAILFVWILDVFFGPAMSQSRRAALRYLPTHETTAWMLGLPGDHLGPVPRPVAVIGWPLVSMTLAALVVMARLSAGRASRSTRRTSPRRMRTVAGAGLRTIARMPAMWALLVLVPIIFVTLAKAVTAPGRAPVEVVESGVREIRIFDPSLIHGAMMAPIAAASLAAVAGLFLAADDRPAERRLAVAGCSRRILVAARLAVVGGLAAAVALVSVVAATVQYAPADWPVYVSGNVLVAVVYALGGMLLAATLGKVSGVFVAFLAPFLDVGITQSPMLQARPSWWAGLLPGWGGVRLAVDGALTDGFDQPAALVASAGWVLALVTVVSVILAGGLPPRRERRSVLTAGGQDGA